MLNNPRPSGEIRREKEGKKGISGISPYKEGPRAYGPSGNDSCTKWIFDSHEVNGNALSLEIPLMKKQREELENKVMWQVGNRACGQKLLKGFPALFILVSRGIPVSQ